jgi:hypothetical protein
MFQLTAMAKRHVLGDTIHVGFAKCAGLSKTTAAFGVFRLEKVTASCAGAQNLAAGCDFKPLCHSFSCLNSFRASHKILSKERAI